MTQNNTWNVLFNQFPLLRDEINLFQNNPDIDYHSALRQFSNNFNTSNTSSNISANFNNIYNKYDLTIYSTSQQLSNTFNKIFNSNLINLNNAEKAFTDSSNYTNNTSNIILNYINDSNLSINNQLELKQNNLTASTNLLGIGSSITQIDAINISSGILPVSRGGIGTTILPNNQLLLGNITSIKSSSLLIYDNFNNRLGVNTTDLTYTLNVNGSINSTSLYQNGSLINFANFATDTELTDGLALKQNILTATTNLLGIGSSITQIDYNKITLNKPDLTLYNSWTKSGNNIYNSITSGNVGIGVNSSITYKLTTNGLSSANGMIIGFGNTMNLYPNIPGNYILLKHNTYNGEIGINNPNPECAIIMANNSSAGELNWCFYSGVVKYFASVTPINSLRYDIGSSYIDNTLHTSSGTNTSFIPLISLLYLGNVGIGSTIPSHKLDVNGSINSTSLYQNGSLINFANFATDTELTDGLALKQNILTATTNLLGIGSSITQLDYNKITLNQLSFMSPLSKDVNNNVSIDLSSYLTNVNDASYVLKSGSTMSGSLNITGVSSKLTFGLRYENILVDLYNGTFGIGVENGFMNFSVPASSGYKFYNNTTTNIATITSEGNLNVSGNLQEAGTNLSSKYLQLSGGSLTNSLTISTGNLSITNATGILSMGSKFLSNIINLYSTSYGIGVPSATEIRFYSPASTNFKFYTGSANTCTITPEGNLNVSGNLQEAGTNLSSKYATITNVNNLVPATATSLTTGNKTINGNLTITNDIILNNIIRFNGDTNVDGQIYHSAGQLKIQFDDYLYFIATSGTDAYINVGKYYGVSYHTLSDERVKYDIHNFNDSNLIQNFLNLEPKFFKYVYKNNNSNINIKNELGFIAQEVEKIFPYAVSYGKDFIPNINKNVECSNNKLIFTPDFDISFLNVNDILNIENKHIKIINIENNIITINESFNKSSVFVYGTQVNDFRSIDKTYLYSINILATQELIRINKEQKEIIENQQKRIESIENELILIKNKLGI